MILKKLLTEGGAIDLLSILTAVIIAVVCSVVFAVIGFIVGSVAKQKANEKEIGSATQEATKIINNALAGGR